MKKVSFIFGTRPEAIKLAPVITNLKKSNSVDVEVCITGQHKEMLNQVMEVFRIIPDIDLKLMSHNQSLGSFFAKSVSALDDYISVSQPDYVIVQGDTSTVLSAALAAFYHKKRVLHVEAGLRTDDVYSPFPEEMNRRLTSKLAFYHFVPTEMSKHNLQREGYANEKIMITGNTGIDALLHIKKKIDEGSLSSMLSKELTTDLNKYAKMILITGHRRENFGEGFINICEAIKQSAKMHTECLFIYPVHLNPNVHSIVFAKLGGIQNIRLLPPQSYVDFVYLMMNASIIITDSGGVQEEAPSLKKPILVMRENTERPEGVIAGCSKLVGVNVDIIVSEITKLLTDKLYYRTFNLKENPYGDGKASERIVDAIKQMSK